LLASSNTFQYDERFAAPEILVYQFSRLKIQAFIFRKKYRMRKFEKSFWEYYPHEQRAGIYAGCASRSPPREWLPFRRLRGNILSV
jgi:hypothetical protein